MKLIKLRNGELAKVDDEKFESLNKHRWYLSHGYAMRKSNGESLFMHRELMNTPEGFDTDHINHDKLDNRLENLRICTVSQNQQNRRKTTGITTSKFKGVSWDKSVGLWRASIKINDKRTTIGRYVTEEAAGLAYNEYAKEHFGEYANLNDIDESIDYKNLTPKNKKSSKYVGVSWNKKYGKWKADFYINGKSKFIGHFDSEEDAAIAYNEKIINFNLKRKLNNVQLNKNT